jgi:hypothetical protein
MESVIMDNKDKIILDLAGGTGAWSVEYAKNGYTVFNITLPYYDLLDERTVRLCINLNPYGILFACPCDIWSNAGVRFWKTRTSDEVLMHSKILVKGLRIIYNTNPVFWCLENPIGKMKEFMGEPAYKFHPYVFGDAYTKKTYLWGKFNIPMFPLQVEPKIRNPVKYAGSNSTKSQTPVSWISGKNRKERRAITPPGFAKAFYEVNK